MISLFGKNEPEPTLLERLKKSVSKTKAALSETVDTIFLGDRKIDPSILKDLETALLSADLGVKPTREILDAVREKMDRNALSDAAQLKREIKSHIIRILNAPVRPDMAAGSGISTSQNGSGTRVIFIVGVNGAGKTTSIGKLANRLRQEGRSVVLCAADTFRAAAVEQLEIRRRPGGRCIRRGCRCQGALVGRRHRGHGGTLAHQIEPHGGTGKNEAHRGESDSRRAARCFARARRHDWAERACASAGIHFYCRRHGNHPH